MKNFYKGGRDMSYFDWIFHLFKSKNNRSRTLFSFGVCFVLLFSNQLTAQEPRKDSGADGRQTLRQLKGEVISARSELPLADVSIRTKSGLVLGRTDGNGHFSFAVSADIELLRFSRIGYKTQEYILSNRTDAIHIALDTLENVLDEAVVIGYGSTTRRLATGSITKVTADEIGRQPVSNPMLALQGLVPGLEVTPSSGINGALVDLKVRGTNSLTQGSEPLVLLDGNPIAVSGQEVSMLSNAASGLSIFNSINPADIESIEVLKDADATAIYGSRGANGVILITTKRNGQQGTKIDFSWGSGVSSPGSTMKMLDTREYFMMRTEALDNSGLELNEANAPDLIYWSDERYTDFRKFLSGSSNSTENMNLTLRGGLRETSFRINAGFYRENFQVNSDQDSRRFSFGTGLSHRSSNERFLLDLTANFSQNSSDLTVFDPSAFLALPPHTVLYNGDGSLNWMLGPQNFSSVGLTNPYGQLENSYKGDFRSLFANLSLSYRLWNELRAKVSTGYTHNTGDEYAMYPSAGINPASGTLPSARMGTSSASSWIVEPQISYDAPFGLHTLGLLLGASIQQSVNEGISLTGNGYTDENLLRNIASAGTVVPSYMESAYKYAALFGRVSYNYDKRYLLNFALRRDGSSRFGSGRRFSGFYSVGAGWIFTGEKFLEWLRPLLSYGKIRSSYGVTGNDQIGDYKFMDNWTSGAERYADMLPVNPTGLYNPDYSWEENRKWELAIDLGLFGDRILTGLAFFRNRSGNQLIAYALPVQTGFASINRNLDALVINEGWEWTVDGRVISKQDLSWNVRFNISMPKNRLVRFPGLEESSYAGTWMLGEPLSVRRWYRYQGVDEQTGIYSFEDVDGNGELNSDDRTVITHFDPVFFGGLTNTFRYKKWQLSFLFDFKKQKGSSYMASLTSAPGYGVTNQPAAVLDRWQQPGDRATFQRYVASVSDPAYTAMQHFISSEGAVSDASFLKLRNLNISYTHIFHRVGLPESVNLFLSAQNLWTLSGYVGADPEIQYIFTTPPMRTFMLGAKLNF
ncbi:SusC/RagA family TonB-linked outer membrane protein [Sphingobacterium sp. LRF_L2]|uniref:SusC/RagA family TonB-linked outer membrane protein n=1 Tax=Sphingobacterium sp. LRF_L2 TaxID=3369421 RepID=UPI003F638E9F